MSTERPAWSGRRPPRLVPRNRSTRDTLAVAPHRARPTQSDESPNLARSDITRFGRLFVDANEVAQCDGVGDIVGFSERVQSQGFFEAGHEDRNTERVEARFKQDHLVGQWRQSLLLFGGNLLDLGNYQRLN